ncbi:chloride channel protein [Pantoea stewartii]|uniref:Cl-channel voltage-gated family protein n=1 Tax=Pantoea stewartii subsp. stewartii DC283 TaxID=660596 RepID=H3RAB5_PANSE|nr:chloride channel protein [Pantoea stewartii]ARF51562.1 Cl- channel voltage-gated family protein [Pantoea stewartii subsp. stewartii DC283]EHU02128.1 putative voltage-gated ClC-type chloride channel protein [Pantoea stewartii subsp. stewartii DC283]KAB0549331.1 Cl- channel voltage-gated family protein [Pantoea stewartii subsp. stewartii]
MKGSKHALNWTTLLIAVPVGGAASLVTLLFRETIEFINYLLFGRSNDITESIHLWPMLFWPVLVGVGGLLAGFFLRYAVAIERQQTVKTDYLEVINARLDAVPTKTSLFRALSLVASIGSGASIGKEGPMVQLAALCGSMIGRLLPPGVQLKNSDVVAMAAAAGLSSVYHAPLASAIFVAEIAFGISALQRLIPLVVSSAVAVMTMWALGFRNALYPLAEVSFTMDVSSLLITVLIGLLSGLAGLLLIRLIARAKTLFSRVRSLPLRLGAGGFAVGLLALVSTDILGNGYEVIVKVMAGHYVLSGLLLLLVLKTLATSLSVGSNAVGGLFTPSLLIGALLGMVIALCGVALHLPLNNVLLFAAVGMAAVLAAVSQAPLMAMLMVLEMTLNSSLLFPVMIASVLATMVVYRLQMASTYPVVTHHFNRSEAKYDFDNMCISELIIPGAALQPEASVGEALAVSSLKRERYVYVINAQGAFLGVVSIHEISRRVLAQEINLDSPVQCVMDEDFPVAYQNQSLREGWEAFAAVTLERLPVLNNPQERRFLGALTKTSLIQKAQEFL